MSTTPITANPSLSTTSRLELRALGCRRNQAIGIAQRDSDAEAERDPVLLFGAGALVLWVFRADIDLAHETGKGWKFRFKTKGLSDSTIAKLLGQLLGAYLKP